MSGRLRPSAIQAVVRANFGAFRSCYEAGLTRAPTLAGVVRARFTIDHTGHVSDAGLEDTTFPDAEVAACVVSSFRALVFPVPEEGIVKVVYPIAFSRAAVEHAEPPPSAPASQ
ncbi:MAG TPA: AgmX/PglI C-terminal domain-containing protein [Polyangiaceae bacterium]